MKTFSRLCNAYHRDQWWCEGSISIRKAAERAIKGDPYSPKEVCLKKRTYLGVPERGIKPLKVWVQDLGGGIRIEFVRAMVMPN